MAHVLMFISLIVQAQSLSDNSILCYIGKDNVSQIINTYITQAEPYSILCNHEEGNHTVPKFLQFYCISGSSLLTVLVSITDGEHTQIITKDIEVNENESLYEMTVLPFVTDELKQSGTLRIKSIKFSNNMNTGVLLSEVNFSNISSNYEVKMNQVFTVDMRNGIQKKYYINSNTVKMVRINLYRENGEIDQKVTKNLVRGENFIHFANMPIDEEKYFIVITEYDLMKTPSSKITVMN